MIAMSLQIFLVMRQKPKSIHLPDRNNSYKSVIWLKECQIL